MKKIEIVVLLMASALSLLSCKKEEEDTTLPSLSGFSINTAIPFVREGTSQEFKLDISNLTTSDGSTPGPLGVAWQVTGSQRDTLTRDVESSNPSFTVKSNKVGNYTVTCYIFSLNEEYYSTSTATSFSVIDPDTALSGQEGDTFEFIGDNKYFIFEAGDLIWMGENLHGTEAGRDYKDCEVVSDVFGRYYTWEEAQTACPDGWRLPTAAEFDSSFGTVAGDLMVNASFQNAAMWDYWPQVKITNAYKFNAIPTGYMDYTTDTIIYGYLEYACWWTADEVEDEDFGVYRYIYEEEPTIMEGKGSKTSLALNVRCVKQPE